MSSTTRGRPPLPPPHGSSSDNKLSRNEGPAAVSQIITESKPQPAARSLVLPRQSPLVEKNIVETHKHSEQEVTNQPPPQPQPRRRLASFGGVSSPGSLSPFTGLGAYNQNNNGNKPAGTGGDMHAHLSSSLGSRGSTGCLRLSPQSSGRSTPVAGLGPMHLLHVRDQMVVALQRLKELEEQVKIIPILQVKISVLQEEKRQLVTQLKSQGDNEDVMGDVICRRTNSMERSDTSIVQNDPTDLKEFRKLTEEMQALERTIKGGQLQAWHGKGHSPLLDITSSKPSRKNKYVHTDQVETRSVATEVSEVNLGIHTEREAELDAQQLIIGALKERISHLEAELKESALQTEMSRLRLELQAAGVRNRADKASLARPSSVSTGVEARPRTTSQGVGNHTEVQDASTGQATEVKSVGVSCPGPEVKDAYTGLDVPMSHWEVRERVETREKGVGIQVFTNTQGVGTEIKSCDAETNTEVPVENLWPKTGPRYRSVACGDCSVDVIICDPKELVSQGMTTDPVRGVDLGIMVSPQTASQRTNTVSSSVSRFTNTRHAFNTDSSTNTLLSTQDKHTNTAQTVSRTVSVGSRVRDISTPETRTIGVGTTNMGGNAVNQTQWTVAKVTRDTGVGFTNINDNFLVGLKTRNMASGPSHLPDPIKTRSIGVGEGRIRDLSASSSTSGQRLHSSTQSQWDSELNHYIEKMQRLLGEHGDLLTADCAQHHSGQGNDSFKMPHSNKAAAQGGADVRRLDSQPQAVREIQSPSHLSVNASKCDIPNPGMCQQGGNNESEVKRMIQMLEQQASSALQDRSAMRSMMKKQNGDQSCSSNRKSLKFMRVTTGLDPMPSYEPSVSEKVYSEEAEKRGNKKSRETAQDGNQGRKGKGGSGKTVKGSAKSHTHQRCKLSAKIISACQVLKLHLSGDTTISSRELHDCLQTLQHEWFSVSSHKSAAADTVDDYLSSFRLVSPSVLQHVANMADGNGNTALHYSVSHSNFGIVKKLLDAGTVAAARQQELHSHNKRAPLTLGFLSCPSLL
ncbi:hypothetical protein INR49_030728 [Caranx melampygus]|nr:hypothetical protein INR49_030728 [Caranx melampygus]